MSNSDKMTSESSTFMLEVPVAFAATKPEIDVIPLGIGGKEDPARLIFDGVTGDGIQVTMVDMGDHFRIICADQRSYRDVCTPDWNRADYHRRGYYRGRSAKILYEISVGTEPSRKIRGGFFFCCVVCLT